MRGKLYAAIQSDKRGSQLVTRDFALRARARVVSEVREAEVEIDEAGNVYLTITENVSGRVVSSLKYPVGLSTAEEQKGWGHLS